MHLLIPPIVALCQVCVTVMMEHPERPRTRIAKQRRLSLATYERQGGIKIDLKK